MFYTLKNKKILKIAYYIKHLIYYLDILNFFNMIIIKNLKIYFLYFLKNINLS